MSATQLSPTLCNLMDCSPPGFSVHGTSQARILECVASPFSWGSSWPRDRTLVSSLQADSLLSEPLGNPLNCTGHVKYFLLTHCQDSIACGVLYYSSLYLAKNYFSKLHSRRVGKTTFNFQAVPRCQNLGCETIQDQFHFTYITQSSMIFSKHHFFNTFKEALKKLWEG